MKDCNVNECDTLKKEPISHQTQPEGTEKMTQSGLSLQMTCESASLDTPVPDETPGQSQPAPDRGIRTYVLRTGRMTAGQKDAITRLGPELCVEVEPGSKFDYSVIFGNDNPVTMEIGFGMGQATWRIAKTFPEMNFLGIEVHTPGIGRLLLDIERERLQNLRLVHYDAVELLEHTITADSLAAFHIFYPDPWPKKRHVKRRLIREGITDLLVSRLIPEGYVYFVTDIEEYAVQALEVLRNTAGLTNQFESYAPRQKWRPETKFESRANGAGRGAYELLFKKTG